MGPTHRLKSGSLPPFSSPAPPSGDFSRADYPLQSSSCNFSPDSCLLQEGTRNDYILVHEWKDRGTCPKCQTNLKVRNLKPCPSKVQSVVLSHRQRWGWSDGWVYLSVSPAVSEVHQPGLPTRDGENHLIRLWRTSSLPTKQRQSRVQGTSTAWTQVCDGDHHNLPVVQARPCSIRGTLQGLTAAQQLASLGHLNMW